MNVVKYVFGFFGWKQPEQVPVPVSESILKYILDESENENENESENESEPKMTLKEFMQASKYERDLELSSEPSLESNFDQKLLNRKNYNQKKKQRKR